MIFPKMYRVFLQDEKDTPWAEKNPENFFRIRYGEIIAGYYCCPPRYKPSIKDQLKHIAPGYLVGPSPEQLDEHWIIMKHGVNSIGIVHNLEEIPDKAYELAEQEAEELAEYLSKKNRKPYIFIDLTSRGDKSLAEKLAQEVHDEDKVYCT